MKKEGQTLTIGCVATGETWQLICQDNTWSGYVGTCPLGRWIDGLKDYLLIFRAVLGATRQRPFEIQWHLNLVIYSRRLFFRFARETQSILGVTSYTHPDEMFQLEELKFGGLYGITRIKRRRSLNAY